MPCKDLDKARAYERERHLRRTAERLDRGLCMKCGKHPLAPGRRRMRPLRREAARVRTRPLRQGQSRRRTLRRTET